MAPAKRPAMASCSLLRRDSSAIRRRSRNCSGVGSSSGKEKLTAKKDQEQTTPTSPPIGNSLPVLLRREEWRCGWLDRQDSLQNVSRSGTLPPTPDHWGGNQILMKEINRGD